MLLPIVLALSTLLCALVAGFLFAFAVVIMPGMKQLKDIEFLSVFQLIDSVIQNKQFFFMLVWMGSIFMLIIAAVLGSSSFGSLGQSLIFSSLVIYVAGVQLPTILINVPLNNYIQSLDIKDLTDVAGKVARRKFESRWVLWNKIRTVFAIIVTAILLFLLAFM